MSGVSRHEYDKKTKARINALIERAVGLTQKGHKWVPTEETKLAFLTIQLDELEAELVADLKKVNYEINQVKGKLKAHITQEENARIREEKAVALRTKYHPLITEKREEMKKFGGVGRWEGHDEATAAKPAAKAKAKAGGGGGGGGSSKTLEEMKAETAAIEEGAIADEKASWAAFDKINSARSARSQQPQ